MTPSVPLPLAAGKAFADVSTWRAIGVTGADALGWLNGLVSAEIGDLVPGRARRSLLLSPVGAVRAEFWVAMVGDRVVLLQDPAQPRSIGDLLTPYILSSDVVVEARDDVYAIFAFPGLAEAPDVSGTVVSAPSCLGAGVDVICPVEDHDRVSISLGRLFEPATAEDQETWRVSQGIPRVGVDTGATDLPQECGLEGAVSYDKGCFLGQEAVARVRNRGHPRQLLLQLESGTAIEPGEGVVVGGAPAGMVTSAASVDGRYVALARVRWEHRDGSLSSARGVELRRRVAA
jgi:folate-binding protein YgfZ